MAKHKTRKRPGKRPHKARARVARMPARRAVEAALAGVAHDIRTPLTGIVALAELLATSNVGAREREWANAIKSGADHLAALTTLIVDAVKADTAGLVLQHEPFSPRRLAEAVGVALIARAGNKGIKAEVLDKGTRFELKGFDKEQLGQLAANIRSIRPPDVYKGKGVRYAGERLRKKMGKAGGR